METLLRLLNLYQKFSLNIRYFIDIQRRNTPSRLNASMTPSFTNFIAQSSHPRRSTTNVGRETKRNTRVSPPFRREKKINLEVLAHRIDRNL